jgi:hypothetical protein
MKSAATNISKMADVGASSHNKVDQILPDGPSLTLAFEGFRTRRRSRASVVPEPSLGHGLQILRFSPAPSHGLTLGGVFLWSRSSIAPT